MSTPSDSTSVLETFLNAVEGRRDDLPDPFHEAYPHRLPAKLRGILAEFRQKHVKIIHAFAKKQGAVMQECITKGVAGSSVLDCQLRQLNRTEESRRSKLKENWYRGLSEGNKTAFDKHCLALAEPILQPFFPPELPSSLLGPLARLALEHAAIGRRFAALRTQTKKSGIERFQNPTVTQSYLDALTYDENEAKTHLVGRWFRELSLEQAAEFDQALQGIDDSGNEQEDNQADIKKKKMKPMPENPELLRLAKRIRQELKPGVRKIDIARSFTEDNEKKAKNLLRGLRRYPHLLE